jgi:hypothetical protein
MRSTFSLDDDVFAVARQRAQRERISLGEAVSRYVREALRAHGQAPASTLALRSKYSVLPVRDEIVTSEQVRRLAEQEGI